MTTFAVTPKRRKRAVVPKLLPILAVLLLLLSGGTTIAKAGVVTACSASDSVCWSHAPDDGGEVPVDADKDIPHHHGSCHGHHVGVPAVDKAFGCLAEVSPISWRRDRFRSPSSGTDPAIRPPIA
jgi:hypothetical protein